MKRKHSTKRALIASVVSLCLCFSMLIGTTYAWFTDSVTSGNNIIKSGTLDVEMAWADGKVDPTSATFTDASAGPIFDYENWEPGYAEARHIKISNVGTLALKYAVRIIPDGEVSALADVIDVYYADPAEQVADRALANLTKLGTLTQVLSGMGATANGTLIAGASDTITLVLKMQESAGNEYQNKSIGSTFSIQLVATQLMAEKDSFGNDYDNEAKYPNVSAHVAIPEGNNATEAIKLVAKDVKVTIPTEVINNLPEEVTSIAVAYTEPQVDANTGVISFESVDLVDQDGNVIDLTNNTTPVNVVLPAQTSLIGKDVVVMHDGVVVASLTVATDGAISYSANHFCEVTVVVTNKVGTVDELVAAVAKGGNIQLTDDITMTDKLTISADTAIYGMGKTLTYTGSTTRVIDVPAGDAVNLTIKNLEIVINNSYCERAINFNNGGELVLDGVVIAGETKATYAINLPSSSNNAKVEINNSTIIGHIALNVWGHDLTINVTNSDLSNYDTTVKEDYPTVVLNNNGSVIAEGTVITFIGGSITAKNQNGEPSTAVRNDTQTGKVTISENTEVVGESRSAVAFIKYKDNNGAYMDNYYASFSLTSALNKAYESSNAVIVLAQDIVLNETITIESGKAVVIDLNGKTIKGTFSGTGNQEMFLVKGDMTVFNGSIEMTATQNQGWNAMATIFDVTAGGALNLDDVNATVSGTDMNFIVHLNNWGAATAIINNCDFDLSYVAVRAFNSGYDMNTVTIKNTDVTGGARLFWVHNYTSEGKDSSTLTLDIYNNKNTSEHENPIRFGFSDSTYYNLEGKQLVTATTLAEVMEYAKKGNVIIDAQDANLGDFYYDGTFGNGTVLKNATFTYVYGASVNGVATFENCSFVSDHSYSANFSDGSYTGKVIFNNCYFDGWSSFGEAITYVEMNNCTFDWNNPYSMLRFYQNAKLNNCTFEDIEGIDTNKTGTVVELSNCTGIEGKIYNNGTNVGTWIVNGTDISDTVTSW